MKRFLPRRHAVILAAAFTAAIGTVGTTAAYSQTDNGERTKQNPGVAKIRILGLNDFHGNLETPTPATGEAPRGGAAYLDAYLDRYENINPSKTIRVHAGDMVGASPLISGYFHDEPAIYATNDMGFDVGTIGNHEFDEGGEEMLRLINGGQRADGLQFKTGANGEQVNTSDPDFDGANYPYVAANTTYDDGSDVLPPYKIVNRNGVRVGFIGVTTEDTPNIVSPDAVAPFEYADISKSVNKYVKELKRRNVEAIVVLAHAGGEQTGAREAVGEIISEAGEMSDDVDVIVAGHTHSTLNLRVDGKLIVESEAFGQQFNSIKLGINRKTGDVVSKNARTVDTTTEGIEPSEDLAALVEDYDTRIQPIESRVVGNAPETLRRPDRTSPTGDGEGTLGNIIADAQRYVAGADIAFMNPGGVRADIQAGEVTFGEIYTVQPFDNGVSSGDLTGAQIKQLLEQQFPPTQAADTRKILQVSGIEVTYDQTRPENDKITSITLEDGTEIDPNATYRVAANSFLIVGGDGFTVFRQAQNVESHGNDIEALETYIDEELDGEIVAPEDNDRITREG